MTVTRKSAVAADAAAPRCRQGTTRTPITRGTRTRLILLTSDLCTLHAHRHSLAEHAPPLIALGRCGRRAGTTGRHP
jgi:hypothetical protein